MAWLTNGTLIKLFADELQIRERCTLGPVSEKAKSKKNLCMELQSKQKTSRVVHVVLKARRGSLSNKEMWCAFCSGEINVEL